MAKKTLAQLNEQFKGKRILIIGNHVMKGQTSNFIEMVPTDKGVYLMKVELELTGEQVELAPENVFVIVKSIKQYPNHN